MRRLLIALLAAAGLTLVIPVVIAAGLTGGKGAGGRALDEIPPELLPHYQAAAGAYCDGLPWQVLAAVGWVESRHADGRADPATGDVNPRIYGPALDGTNGTRALRGTDGAWQRAEGPMQFLPSTWARWKTLAPGRPGGSRPSPHNAWDAIHTAARYLCAGQPTIDDVEQALLRYNRSSAYVDDVLAKAAEYETSTSAAGVEVVAHARRMVGVDYVWGGHTPAGFDCSGLVWWAYHQIGVDLPRTTTGQIHAGQPVDIGDLQPGDLVFTRGGRPVRDLGHVAIYAGDGQVVVAPATGQQVAVRPVQPGRIQAVRRILGQP